MTIRLRCPLACLAGTGFMTLLVGCQSAYVGVPAAAHDRPPSITVHALPSGPGRVSPGEVSVTTGTPVGVTVGTTVLITVDATGPGGVKSLSIAVYQGGNKLSEAITTGVPNSEGLVPKTLSIIGHNGSGGVGGNPLYFVLDHLYQVAYVKAAARNFNNQESTLQVNFEALPSDLVK